MGSLKGQEKRMSSLITKYKPNKFSNYLVLLKQQIDAFRVP